MRRQGTNKFSHSSGPSSPPSSASSTLPTSLPTPPPSSTSSPLVTPRSSARVASLRSPSLSAPVTSPRTPSARSRRPVVLSSSSHKRLGLLTSLSWPLVQKKARRWKALVLAARCKETRRIDVLRGYFIIPLLRIFSVVAERCLCKRPSYIYPTEMQTSLNKPSDVLHVRMSCHFHDVS